MEFHEAANIFPMLTGDEFRVLVDDIRANGQIEPIWLYQGDILDGRNRYAACLELGIEPKFTEYTGTDPLGFVVSMNVMRRHLTKDQRVDVMRQMRARGAGYQEIAKATGVSTNTAWRATKDVKLFEIEKLPGADGKSRPPAYTPRQTIEQLKDAPLERADVRELEKLVREKKAEDHRNSTVTYHNQPAIHATRGAVPLAGNSHLYTVEKQLWPEDVETVLNGLLIGRSLHLCCGKSKLGDVRLDLNEPDADIQADAAHTGLDDKCFDTVLCDPPYNGEFQWNHDLLEELARLALCRIVFQHWFIPADPDGQYKKANYFKLTGIYVWQPRTYFGRAQLISVFDAQ